MKKINVHYPLTSIIIPGFNEEKNIARVVKDVLKLPKKYPIEIIVVDDGSKDRTSVVAKKAGATHVIRYEKNKGKGGAFRVGIDNAKGEYIVQIDADHQFQPSEIPQFIELLHGGTDIVLGSRFNKGTVEKGSVTRLNLFGNWLMSFTTTFFSGIKVTDIMAGFKGFKTSVARELDLVTQHFGYEAEIIVKAGKLGFTVKEVPITYTKRVFGNSGVNAIRDGSKVSFTIMKLYFTFPGPPLGQGIVGKRLVNLFLPIWILICLPSVVLLNSKLILDSNSINYIFYSIVFFICFWLLTKSKFGAIFGSLSFASSNFIRQADLLPAQLILPKEFINDPLINSFHSITLIAIFLGFVSLFLQSDKNRFFKQSYLTLVFLTIYSILFFNSNRGVAFMFNLGLTFVGLILFRYFWKFEKWIAWSYLASSAIFLVSSIYPITFSGILGLSLFLGTLVSSLFLEISSFRQIKLPLFSFKRLILLFLLAIFTASVFSLKFLVLFT